MSAKYEQLRQQLIQEKESIEQRLEENDHYQLERSMTDSDGELSHYDNHPADMGTALFERGKDLALHEHERHHLEDIDQALERMEAGTYGLCARCGQEIDLERLKASPTAQYCIDHQLDRRYTSDRPIEEEVLTGFGQFNFDGRDDETEFDAEDAWQAVGRFNELPSVNYDDLDSEEPRGYVEAIEGFIITDLEGNVVEESVDFNRNRTYEDYLDNGEGYGVIWEDEVLTPEQEGEHED